MDIKVLVGNLVTFAPEKSLQVRVCCGIGFNCIFTLPQCTETILHYDTRENRQLREELLRKKLTHFVPANIQDEIYVSKPYDSADCGTNITPNVFDDDVAPFANAKAVEHEDEKMKDAFQVQEKEQDEEEELLSNATWLNNSKCDFCNQAFFSATKTAVVNACPQCTAYETEGHRQKIRRRCVGKEDSFLDQEPSLDKITVNKMIVLAAEVVLKGRQKTAKALTLDGSGMYTSGLWTASDGLGLSGQNVTVPNPFSYDELKQTQSKNHHLPLARVNIRCELVYDTLKSLKTNGVKDYFSLVYLDYCCTKRGNEHTRPMIDLDMLFRPPSLLSDHCIVAIQVSPRQKDGAKRATPATRYKRTENLESHIVKCAAKHGFKAQQGHRESPYLYEDGQYRFFLFEVTRYNNSAKNSSCDC